MLHRTRHQFQSRQKHKALCTGAEVIRPNFQNYIKRYFILEGSISHRLLSARGVNLREQFKNRDHRFHASLPSF